MNTRTLYRPVGPAELELIRQSGWREFPPRLPDQPIFYPVLNEAYAIQIARDWNVKASGSGYVTRFAVSSAFLDRYARQTVGAAMHEELWIPAEDLAEMNANIVGLIEVTAQFPPAPDSASAGDLPMSREALTAAMGSGLAPRWLFFWGHTPAKDGSVGKTCFSQWWAGHPFELEDITYATAEHWMMAEKARLFGDEAIRSEILTASHPNAAKKLGRTVRGFDEAEWHKARWGIVVAGNDAKFRQHPELRTFLLNTGDRILVEASPYDTIWGNGLSADDPRAINPGEWRGLNLLGFALMAVRLKLKAEA
jgi:ribA/ribD-fused uncharacterized protein